MMTPDDWNPSPQFVAQFPAITAYVNHLLIRIAHLERYNLQLREALGNAMRQLDKWEGK